MPVREKRCKDCREIKPRAAFYEFTLVTGRYLSSRCRPCQARYGKPYQRTEEYRRWHRDWYRRRRHGLAKGEFETLVAAQNGRCAICRRLPPKGKDLVIDHDHATKKRRGLLCAQCNSGIGFFR